ncbi:MAG: purine-nucleoside phosphorylase [Ferruginibacter sp.]
MAFIKAQYDQQPTVGIILGSGLGNFTKEIVIEKEIPYSDIPYFPLSTVKGHSGKLVFGQLAGKTVVAMSGRFHFYEGYTAEEIVFPIRVMKWLGIETLLISNAAGATNQNYKIGDLMLINDHISFFQPNALIGKNETAFGPRFQDMSAPYKKTLITKAKAIAAAANIDIKEGVYCGVTGPTFETLAEYRLLLAVGVDAVGMSTVQEVIVAAHMGIPVLAISVITDLAVFEGENTITLEEVLEAATAAEPKLSIIIKGLVEQL